MVVQPHLRLVPNTNFASSGSEWGTCTRLARNNPSWLHYSDAKELSQHLAAYSATTSWWGGGVYSEETELDPTHGNRYLMTL